MVVCTCSDFSRFISFLWYSHMIRSKYLSQKVDCMVFQCWEKKVCYFLFIYFPTLLSILIVRNFCYFFTSLLVYMYPCYISNLIYFWQAFKILSLLIFLNYRSFVDGFIDLLPFTYICFNIMSLKVHFCSYTENLMILNLRSILTNYNIVQWLVLFLWTLPQCFSLPKAPRNAASVRYLFLPFSEVICLFWFFNRPHLALLLLGSMSYFLHKYRTHAFIFKILLLKLQF